MAGKAQINAPILGGELSTTTIKEKFSLLTVLVITYHFKCIVTATYDD